MNEFWEWLACDGCHKLQPIRIFLVYCQIGIYTFMAIALFSVWKHVRNAMQDFGLLLLALFFVFAVLSSFLSLALPDYQPDFPKEGKPLDTTTTTKALLTLLGITFSALNSWCLLASFSHFNIVKSSNWKIFESQKWKLNSAVIAIIVVVITPILQKLLPANIDYLYKAPDVVLSTFMFSVLAFILFRQFKSRNAKRLAYISIAVCFLIITSQIFFLFGIKDSPADDYFFQSRILFNFANLITTAALGTIFLTLAYTWIVEEFDIEERSKETQKEEENLAEVKRQLASSQAELSNLRQTSPGVSNSESIEKPTLKIGINEENEYFFLLNFPKKEIVNFEFKERKLVNLFKFLLSYAYAKTEGKQHTGVPDFVTYTYENFNNAIIQQLKTKLLAAGFNKKEIKRDDLLISKGRSWELNIPVENVEIVGKEKIFREEDLTNILQALT